MLCLFYITKGMKVTYGQKRKKNLNLLGKKFLILDFEILLPNGFTNLESLNFFLMEKS